MTLIFFNKKSLFIVFIFYILTISIDLKKWLVYFESATHSRVSWLTYFSNFYGDLAL